MYFSLRVGRKISHHMKGKATEYVYLVKNYVILENILAVFMNL